MTDLLTYLAEHRAGLVTLGLLLLAVLLIVQWLAWIFGWGRFRHARTSDGYTQGLRFVLADLLVKIIDDFRHLLALVVMLIFALALGYVLVMGGPDMEAKIGAAQALLAALSGLIGSIVGYYFGESSAVRGANRSETADVGTGGAPEVEQAAEPPPIRSAPMPPPPSPSSNPPNEPPAS